MELDPPNAIRHTRERVGWAYEELPWPSRDDAAAATRQREELVASMPPSVQSSFGGSKLHHRSLSPGCRACGEGGWSCLFLNRLCNQHCFFCPADQTEDRPPSADGIEFGHPDELRGYLETFDIRAVGISGGEPLMDPGKLLRWVGALKRGLGDRLYLWAYTNGTLATRELLNELAELGLDELRVDVCATGYQLDAVERAVLAVPAVSVEIPAIPEDVERVEACLVELDRLGVRTVNLHQFLVEPPNFRAFQERGYTFLHGRGVSVLESELAALRLVRAAADRGLSLGVSHCASTYKQRYQSRASRARAARLVAEPWESSTHWSYLRRLAVRGTAEDLQRAEAMLRREACDEALWRRTEADGLLLHVSLLRHLDGFPVTVNYFDATLEPECAPGADVRTALLEGERAVRVERRRVLRDVVLDPGTARVFRQLTEREDPVTDPAEFLLPSTSPGDLAALVAGARTLLQCEAFEHLPRGLGEIC